MRQRVTMKLAPVEAPVPLGVLELPLAAGRPAMISAWISPPSEGGVRLCSPVHGHDGSGEVIRHDATLDRLIGVLVSAPPGLLSAEGIAGLTAMCGFEGVREPGYPDRLFLSSTLVVCAYEDASEALQAAGHGDGAEVDPASTEGRRLASAVLRLGHDGTTPDARSVNRDLSRIGNLIGDGTRGYHPDLVM
ncbi:MAG: hypothetical protein AAF762_08010 [Pseudomonadota bacterium]